MAASDSDSDGRSDMNRSYQRLMGRQSKSAKMVREHRRSIQREARRETAAQRVQSEGLVSSPRDYEEAAEAGGGGVAAAGGDGGWRAKMNGPTLADIEAELGQPAASPSHVRRESSLGSLLPVEEHNEHHEFEEPAPVAPPGTPATHSQQPDDSSEVAQPAAEEQDAPKPPPERYMLKRRMSRDQLIMQAISSQSTEQLLSRARVALEHHKRRNSMSGSDLLAAQRASQLNEQRQGAGSPVLPGSPQSAPDQQRQAQPRPSPMVGTPAEAPKPMPEFTELVPPEPRVANNRCCTTTSHCVIS